MRPFSSVYPEMHCKGRTLNEGLATYAVRALAEVREYRRVDPVDT
jgi:hypothetical protein